MQPKISKKDFEYIVKYIDNNIFEEQSVIIQGLCNTAKWCLQEFKQFIRTKNKMRLKGYIFQRKMYYTFLELVKKPDIEIGATAELITNCCANHFNRQFHAIFGLTPTEARLNPEKVSDNILIYEEFCIKEEHTMMSNNNTITYEPNNWLLEIYEYANSEYGFSLSLCQDMINFAEKLGVSARQMIDACFNMIVDAQSDDEYYWSPKIEVGVDLGLSSSMELDEICEYFGCACDGLRLYS